MHVNGDKRNVNRRVSVFSTVNLALCSVQSLTFYKEKRQVSLVRKRRTSCQFLSFHPLYLQSSLRSVCQSSVSRISTLTWYVMDRIPQLLMVGGTSGTSNSSTAHEREERWTIFRWQRSVLDFPQRDLKEIVCTRNIVVWYVCVSGRFLISVVSIIRSRGQYALRSVNANSFSGEAIPLYKQFSDFWASPKVGN